MFQIDPYNILANKRVTLCDWVWDEVYEIEKALQYLEQETGTKVVQSGRVIAVRSTDVDRLYSSFKSSIYMSKYKDMDNRRRFLDQMVKQGHSYEPIRGESILFLYVGVGKPVYDHLTTYTVGRPTRIAAGQRANLPWGYEVPAGAKDPSQSSHEGMEAVNNVIRKIRREGDNISPERLEDARSLLPVGYVMPPFLLEYSEEALIKTVFTQRLFERGAQGATVEIVDDMWRCCLKIDKEKWEYLYDYHGPHIHLWTKAMRALRDKSFTYEQLTSRAKEPWESLYELIMQTVGKEGRTMWDRIAEGKADEQVSNQ
ncbi:hypothetical protein [Brevibacillus migulae]|uniref:hypothetical protein n=1 Tax=Brevibacillus migulae TaxID=1644114 RepID=UPI00106E0C53|nr:hypothetical protein [Brevibacillus migulae]